jgi:hypothetical protein
MTDRNKKGRQAFLKGSKNGHHILTEIQVREIKFGNMNTKECMNMFGISQPTVSAIRCNRSWKHIK